MILSGVYYDEDDYASICEQADCLGEDSLTDDEQTVLKHFHGDDPYYDDYGDDEL